MKIAVLSTTYNKIGYGEKVLETYPDLKKLNHIIDNNKILMIECNTIVDLEMINKITKLEIVFNSDVKIYDKKWDYVTYKYVIEIYDSWRE